jgi:hypothetical protein
MPSILDDASSGFSCRGITHAEPMIFVESRLHFTCQPYPLFFFTREGFKQLVNSSVLFQSRNGSEIPFCM